MFSLCVYFGCAGGRHPGEGRQKMKKSVVWFEESCIKCAMCAEEAPEVIVFEATTGPQLKEDVDIVPHSEKIKRAAQFCPKDSIKHHLQ